MKLLLIALSTLVVTGCSSTQTALAVKEPDFRTPEQVRRDRGYADNQGNFRDSRGLVNTSSGSFLVGRQGGTVTVMQTSRGR